MRHVGASLIAMGCLMAAGAVSAASPPQNALALSQILQSLEQQDDVAYFDEIEWDDDGYWEIEYVSRNGEEVTVEIDPVSGQSRN
ncbi:MAG TPA: PepSY domain-containing protein [Arenibaculum sp.]|nr:PepSY domain-containing protein [Arenibaculum sp.]